MNGRLKATQRVGATLWAFPAASLGFAGVARDFRFPAIGGRKCDIPPGRSSVSCLGGVGGRVAR